MKNFLLALLVTNFAVITNAQWTTNGNHVYNTNSGNVGIGISSPAGKLHIYQPSNDHAYSILGRSNNAYQAFRSFEPAGSLSHSNPKWLIGMKQGSADFEIQSYDGTSSNERLYITTTGQMGVGTTQPRSKLEVIGRTQFSSALGGSSIYLETSDLPTTNDWSNTRLIAGSDGGSGFFKTKLDNHGGFFSWSRGSANGDVEVMRIDATQGNVGIGTTSPQSKLHIAGTTKVGGYTFIAEPGGGLASVFANNIYSGASNNTLVRQQNNDPGNYISLKYDRGITFGTGVNSTGGAEVPDYINERMRIDLDGNVGIGTSRPQSKLAVNGDITAKKVKVAQTGWPDYVFHSSYQLPSLQEVEKYITTHKHLPGVASAQEVEANGLNIGENQAVLLKKIEELTLYVIEQNKKLEEQNERIEKLQLQTSAQEKKIANLSNETRVTTK